MAPPGEVPRRRLSPAPTPPRAWIVVALLFVFFILNFADRVVVGLAGTPIMADLELTANQFGLAQSVFFWFFAVGALAGGMALGRVPVRWLLAGTAVLWAVSLAPLAIVADFRVLVASRALLGFAEGPTGAMLAWVIHTWFTGPRRATPTAIASAGAPLGAVVAAPALTMIITRADWQAAFAVLTIVGLLWVPLWLAFGGQGPIHDQDQSRSVDATPHPWGALAYFRRPRILALTVLTVAAYVGASANITWLPLYLEHALGYRPDTVGRLIAAMYAATGILVLLGGLASRWLTVRGASALTARALLPAALVLASGMGVILFSRVGPGPVSVLLLVSLVPLGSTVLAVIFSGISDEVPTDSRGTVFGAIIAIYSVGAAAAPLIVGRSVGADPTAGGYRAGLNAVGIIVVVGAISAIAILARCRPS